jgi:hypothetical protein
MIDVESDFPTRYVMRGDYCRSDMCTRSTHTWPTDRTQFNLLVREHRGIGHIFAAAAWQLQWCNILAPEKNGSVFTSGTFVAGNPYSIHVPGCYSSFLKHRAKNGTKSSGRRHLDRFDFRIEHR